ncbi:hypothetical protein ACSBR2_003469 [Camellia fascicularis]
MVFSSIPAYLDPSNWQQQQQNPQIGTSSGNGNPHLPPPPLPPPPHQGDGSGSVRPGSVADRARMANIPMPEAALKCPRCESTNTVLLLQQLQPHSASALLQDLPEVLDERWCSEKRSCGRWLPEKQEKQRNVGTASLLGLTPQIPPLRFMAAPLSQLTDHHHHHYGEIGLNYSGISAPLVVTSDMNMNFHLGSSSLGLGGGGGGGSGIEQWRLQQPTQISPMAGLDFPGVLYPFQGGVEPSGYGGEGSQVRPKPPGLGFTTHQLGSVKMEDNQVQELNLSRQFLGIPGNDQYWSGSSSAWTDLSGFSSSSTRNPL